MQALGDWESCGLNGWLAEAKANKGINVWRIRKSFAI
jgi:hypothetical protein